MKLTLAILLTLLGRMIDAHSCDKRTQYEVNNLCCEKCPPSQYVAKTCTEHNQTVCEPCEAGTFTKKFNEKSECDTCPTQQYYDINLSFCMNCRRCGIGEYPFEKCSRTQNSACRKCPEGHFSNITDNYNLPCIACTKCRRYKVNCTLNMDAVCDKEPTTRATTSTNGFEDTQGTEILIQTTGQSKPENKDQSRKKDDNTYFILAVVLAVVVVVALPIIYYCTRRKVRCQSGEKIGRSDKSVHYQPLQTGLLLRDQPAWFILKLAEFLNPETKPNWRELAAKFGDFTYDEIANIAVDKTKAAENMLSSWQAKNTATLDKLYQCLLEIKREDVATYVAESVNLLTGSNV